MRDVDTNSSGAWFNQDKASEFVLRLDRQRLGLHGLTARDVVNQVVAAVAGQVQRGNIRISGEEVRFDVKIAGNEDVDVHDLRELLLLTPTGEGVRLDDVATLSERDVLAARAAEKQLPAVYEPATSIVQPDRVL